MRYRPGLRPGPRWGSLRRSPCSLVGWGGGYLLTTPHATPRSSRLLKCCVYNLKVTANIQQYSMTTEPYVCKRFSCRLYTCSQVPNSDTVFLWQRSVVENESWLSSTGIRLETIDLQMQADPFLWNCEMKLRQYSANRWKGWCRHHIPNDW